MTTERRTAPRKGQVAFERLPDPELLTTDLHFRVSASLFNRLQHVAISDKRKLSDTCRLALEEFERAHPYRRAV